MVAERFAKKKDLLDLNMRCVDEGYRLQKEQNLTVAMPKPKKEWQKCLVIPGSKAMGLGAVHAGVRLYAGYPMTPSSPLLSYIAEIQNETGMVIKQAEDEITAAQIVSGAMHMGTRALTGTSGGGFDLMSETVSLNGIIENPSVFVLAQRRVPRRVFRPGRGKAIS
jgi:2-oxoglutarate ferredoxin oxidoreductase subunit alpha